MASSPDNTTTIIPSVDTNLLRNALRIVHCMQKERGSSCAYYADNAAFENAMMDARAASDIAASLMQHRDLPIASSLQKIRNLITKNMNPLHSTDTLVLHRIFVCFNTLVSSVVHEWILKEVGVNVNGGNKRTTTIKNRHRRGLSVDINEKLVGNFLTPELGLHKTEGAPKIRSSDQILQTVESEDFGENSANDEGESSTAPPPPPPPTATEASSASSFEIDSTITTQPLNESPSRQKVHFSSSPNRIPKVQQLLDLLHIFVQLKESAGMERAILSSLLAFRNHDDSHRMILNDLILEVENQRSLVVQLEQLPDSIHRNMVLELAQLSTNLEELQTIILNDFDSLQNALYDSELIWNMITLYIDKLHSVELLIIEELECSLPIVTTTSVMKRVTSASSLSVLLMDPSPGTQQQPPSQTVSAESSLSPAEEHILAVDQVLEQWFPPTNGHDLLSQIESMSGDEIKKRVLEVLKAEECASDASNSSTSENQQQHQYSAAMNLKDNMQKALVTNPLNRAASKEWEISIYEIQFTKRIGQGASATTYLATWTGQNVAVKVASITQFGLEGWRTEVATLQRLHHPNVIRLLGSIYHQNPLTYCLVLEYCNAGDLATALKYPTPRNFFFHVAISIANAMTYLHIRHVIHRDLKPGNVLCDGNIASGNFTVKVTDFGVATEAGVGDSCRDGGDSSSTMTNTKHLTGETGTYRWMAPEVIRHEAYSSSADVYSFAIMVWQFLTHEEPFLEETSAEAARLVAMEQGRPPMPPGTPKAIADLIQVNWSNQPSERWKFEKVGESLKAIQSSMAADEKTWLEFSDGHPVYVYDDELFETDDKEKDKQPNNKKGAKQGQGKQLGKGAQLELPGHSKRRNSLLSTFFGSSRKSGKK